MNTQAGRTPLDTTRPLTIAVMAMGGQGGGVLVDWIVELCEGNGWVAQASSVPGVAQRTQTLPYRGAADSQRFPQVFAGVKATIGKDSQQFRTVRHGR